MNTQVVALRYTDDFTDELKQQGAINGVLTVKFFDAFAHSCLLRVKPNRPMVKHLKSPLLIVGQDEAPMVLMKDQVKFLIKELQHYVDHDCLKGET